MTRFIHHWMLLLLVIALPVVGCGGSGSSKHDPEDCGFCIEGDTGEANDEIDPDVDTDPNAIGNLVVVDFAAPTTHITDEWQFRYRLTLHNSGTGTITPGRVIMLISATPDFSSGFLYEGLSLSPDGESPVSLGPGETGIYSTSSSFNQTKMGENYVQAWVNPPEYEVSDKIFGRSDILAGNQKETDYTDNLSSVWPVNVVTRDGSLLHSCDFDLEESGEENDSIEDAAMIALNTEYSSTLCLDYVDVYAINLISDKRYELDFAESDLTTELLVIGPDGKNLIKETVSDFVFTPESTGIHHIVLYNANGWNDLHGTMTFTIKSLGM